MEKPDITLVARCIAVIASEYELDSKGTEKLARIVKATVDTYKPAPTKTDQK